MEKKSLQVKGTEITSEGRPLLLRGAGLGNYMNIEHSMFGLPRAECQIRQTINAVYGEQNASLFWNRFHGIYYGDDDFAWFKELGLNSVRLAMNYRHFELDENPGIYRPEGFELLDHILKMAERHGLYVILDMHAAPGGQNPDWHSDNTTGTSLFWTHKNFQERLVSLWKAIARRCRDNPWVGGYDLINEPVPPDRQKSGLLVNNFYHHAVAEIRTVDRNHIIFTEGNFYSQDTRDFIPFKDPQVAGSVHFYPFFGLGRETEKRKKLTDPEREEQVTHLMKKSFSQEDIHNRLGRPIWCGETGVPSSSDDPEGMLLLQQDTLKALEKLRISWSLWNGKDSRAMGLIRPKKDSLWMELSHKIKTDWDIGRELYSARKESEAMVDRWEMEEERREQSIRDVQFRIMAIRQIEETAKMEKVLRKVPFQDLLKAVESFRFENCEIWSEAETMIKSVTRAG